MSELFNKWRESLDRTRKATFGRIVSVFGGSEVNQETWDDLEALLIQADVGVETSQYISHHLRKAVQEQGIITTTEFQQALGVILRDLLLTPIQLDIETHHPAVILLVGVNGSGKTTTAAKLGNLYAREGKKVLLAAGDTYRAAAIDQLQVWGERLNLPVIAGQPDSDPGAVAYDSVQAAIARNMDILLIDTAGRLHTRYNLMEELKKVNRVVGKALPGAPHAVLLVLDATTGQNAIVQAKIFNDEIGITGIVLTKLDGTSKGGIVVRIAKELRIPLRDIGIGEGLDDLRPFNSEEFVKAIFE